MKSFLLTAIVLFAFFCATGQTTNPSFKKIQYANYQFENGEPEISFYTEIIQDGTMKLYEKIYKGPETTIAKLNPHNIKVLNTVFNGSKKLSAFVVNKKFERGVHYAGDYHFVIYTDSKGVSDTLTFILPFMSASFTTNFEQIQQVFYKSKTKPARKPLKLSSRFVKSLMENHRKTTYLPKFEAPPPGL